MQLTNTIMDIVQQASNYKQLRKGANEGAMAGSHAYMFMYTDAAGPVPHLSNQEILHDQKVFSVLQRPRH